MIKKTSNREIALNTAVTLFLTKGFHITSMDDIVAHSKVSKTNIYYHFKSKEELLLVIVEQLISNYQNHINWLLSLGEETVQKKLERFVGLLTEYLEHKDCLGGCPFLTLYVQTVNESAEVKSKFKDFFEQQFLSIESLLAEGISKQELPANLPVESTAALIISSIEGALFLSKSSNRPELLKNVLHALAILLK